MIKRIALVVIGIAAIAIEGYVSNGTPGFGLGFGLTCILGACILGSDAKWIAENWSDEDEVS